MISRPEIPEVVVCMTSCARSYACSNFNLNFATFFLILISVLASELELRRHTSRDSECLLLRLFGAQLSMIRIPKMVKFLLQPRQLRLFLIETILSSVSLVVHI